MANPMQVYTAVDAFLRQQGYHAHLRRTALDGHMLRHSLAELRASACACAEKGCCVNTCLTNLFSALSDIPGWSAEHEKEALRAGGYGE